MIENMNNEYREKEFLIKNIDMYITREQIITWALHLYGERYVRSSGCNRVDLEHHAEQDLKKEKIKVISKKFINNTR